MAIDMWDWASKDATYSFSLSLSLISFLLLVLVLPMTLSFQLCFTSHCRMLSHYIIFFFFNMIIKLYLGRSRQPKQSLSLSLFFVACLINQESSTMYDHSDKLPVGAKVQAVWSDDGEWYYFFVVFGILNVFYYFNFVCFTISFFFSVFDQLNIQV